MNRRNILVALGLFSMSVVADAQVWDMGHLAEVKAQISRPFYKKSLASLLVKADSLLFCRPLSVTDKDKTAASGDIHDYLSQARI